MKRLCQSFEVQPKLYLLTTVYSTKEYIFVNNNFSGYGNADITQRRRHISIR